MAARALAHGRGLLLDPRLPAWHRPPRGRRRRAARHVRPRPGDAARCPADLRPGRAPLLRRSGVDRDAREPAPGLERQAPRAHPARVRGHGLRHYHDAVGRGRHQARHRESVPAPVPRRRAGRGHPDPPRPAGRRVPLRVPGGDRDGRGRRHPVPRAEPGRARARSRRDRRPAGAVERLAPRPRGPGRLGHDRRRRSASVPEARARDERLRDRRLGDAPDRRRRVRCPAAARRPAAPRPDPPHAQAPRRRGGDHERDARALECGDDAPDLARRTIAKGGRRAGARSPTSPTGSSAPGSHRSTTSGPSSSSGWPAPRRWRDC